MANANCPDALISDLPDDPGCALAYHYGMLLGAADLRTEQGFHIGQRRRHARSLHGRGVVQGLDVRLIVPRAELRVAAGLALDARGRELLLAEAHCLGLPAWWRAHRDEPAFAEQQHLDVVTLQLGLLIRHRVCAERPLPAIAPSCSDGEAGLQASRLCESASLELVDASGWTAPGHGVPPADLPVYALLGLAPELPGGDADVDWAVAARAAVAAAAPEDRVAAALAALDRAIALTTARLDATPPEGDDALAIARLHDLVLKRDPAQGDDAWVVESGRLEILERPALLATATIQRLLAGLLAASSPVVAAPVLPPPPPPAPPEPPAPAPPAVLPALIASASFDDERLTLNLAEAVHAGSAQATAFAVAEFDDVHGWRSFSVRHVDVEAGGSRLLLTLGHPPRETLARVVLDLAGRKPLLALDRSELGARYRNAFTISL